jgi:hypothetical protein
VQRVAIHIAVHSDGANAHLFAGPDDSAGDLAAIGDQDLAEASGTVSHKNTTSCFLPMGVKAGVCSIWNFNNFRSQI